MIIVMLLLLLLLEQQVHGIAASLLTFPPQVCWIYKKESIAIRLIANKYGQVLDSVRGTLRATKYKFGERCERCAPSRQSWAAKKCRAAAQSSVRWQTLTKAAYPMPHYRLDRVCTRCASTILKQIQIQILSATELCSVVRVRVRVGVRVAPVAKCKMPQGPRVLFLAKHTNCFSRWFFGFGFGFGIRCGIPQYKRL